MSNFTFLKTEWLDIYISVLLFGQPYTDIHYNGLSGVFPQEQSKVLLDVVKVVNMVVRREQEIL